MHGYNALKSLAAAALSYADPTGEHTQCSGRLQAAMGGGEWKETQGFMQPPRRGEYPPETNVPPLWEDHQLPPQGRSTYSAIVAPLF